MLSAASTLWDVAGGPYGEPCYGRDRQENIITIMAGRSGTTAFASVAAAAHAMRKRRMSDEEAMKINDAGQVLGSVGAASAPSSVRMQTRRGYGWGTQLVDTAVGGRPACNGGLYGPGQQPPAKWLAIRPLNSCWISRMEQVPAPSPSGPGGRDRR